MVMFTLLGRLLFYYPDILGPFSVLVKLCLDVLKKKFTGRVNRGSVTASFYHTLQS